MSIQQILSGTCMPIYQWDLASSIDSITGSLVGTHVRDSVANYFHPTTGYLNEAAVNIPRFELVGGHLALLTEPVGTNLVTNDMDFSAWTTSDVSIAANETGPDNSANSATTITDDNVAVDDYLKLAVNPATNNSKYTYSVYVKEGTSADFTLIVQDTGASATRAEIDFEWSAGDLTVKAEDTGTGAVKQVGSTSWWRATVYVPANVIVEANNHEVRIYPTENGRQAAETIIVYGAQFEEKAIATSLIHTEGSTVTRATELGYPLWDLPPNLFGAEGTVTIWFRPGYTWNSWVAGSSAGIISCANLSGSLISHYRSGVGTEGRFASNDSIRDIVVVRNWSINTWYKLAVKWGYDVSGTEKFRIGIDFGSGVSWGIEADFDGAFTVGSYLRIGYNLFGPMHTRKLMLFRKALSDTMINHFSGSPA